MYTLVRLMRPLLFALGMLNMNAQPFALITLTVSR
jgi:hypothetical protein